MTSKFNFKLLPISHLAFHFQNQTPLLPAFFFKNLPFWPNSYKIHPPPKILFLPKKKGHVSISPQIDLFVYLWAFFQNLPFWRNSYKINPPPKNPFLPKKKGHVSISPQIDFVFLLSFAEKKGYVSVLPKILFQTWISDTFLSLNSASRRNWTRHWIASKSSERISMNIFLNYYFISFHFYQYFESNPNY